MQNKSFTLIELIVAIFVILVGILAVFLVITDVTSTTSVYKQRLIAAYLAQEGIEIVRNIRDTNWVEGAATWDDGLLICPTPNGCEVDYSSLNLTPWSGDGNYLKIDGGFYNYASGADTIFKRKIRIEAGGDVLQVWVEVFWDIKGKPYSFLVSEWLYEWR